MRGFVFYTKNIVRYTKEERKIISTLKKILGFRPKKLDLYKKSFIHKSATYITHKGDIINNERLEFLGDAILDAVISDYLYKNYSNFDEGKLTQTRSKMVNTKQLSIYNQQIGINNFLETHTQNQLNKKHLYADALEAFIGAIYLDKGYKKTYNFIKSNIIEKTDLVTLINTETNHKSRLLERSQKKNFEVEFETKIHDEEKNIFVAKIFINNKEISKGYAKTKKDAEQEASYLAMKKINPDYNNVKKNNKNNNKQKL